MVFLKIARPTSVPLSYHKNFQIILDIIRKKPPQNFDRDSVKVPKSLETICNLVAKVFHCVTIMYLKLLQIWFVKC